MDIKEFASYFKRAHDGKKLWKKIKRQYLIDDETQIVIMPENDMELNCAAYKYLDFMMSRRSAKRALIIKLLEVPIEKSSVPKNFEIEYCELSDDAIMKLLHYYELFIFSRNLSIISYSKPNGNMMYKFIGKNGLNAEDAVYLGMYNLRYIPKGGNGL